VSSTSGETIPVEHPKRKLEQLLIKSQREEEVSALLELLYSKIYFIGRKHSVDDELDPMDPASYSDTPR